MLRGIRKASPTGSARPSWRVVMGLLIISFAIWGIGDIFRGFGRIDRRQDRQHRDLASSSSARSTTTACSSSAARSAGRSRPTRRARSASTGRCSARSIAETALDERARAAAASASPTPRSPRRITERSDLPRPHRPVRPQPLRAADPPGRLSPSRASSPSSAACMLRRQIVATRQRRACTCRRPRSTRVNRYQNEQRTHRVRRARPRAGRRHSGADAGGAGASISRSARSLFRAPEYRKIDAAGADAGRHSPSWIEVSDADAQDAPTSSARARYVTPERRARPADRVPERGGGAGGRRAHRQGRELRRHRHRARPQGRRTSISAP